MASTWVLAELAGTFETSTFASGLIAGEALLDIQRGQRRLAAALQGPSYSTAIAMMVLMGFLLVRTSISNAGHR